MAVAERTIAALEGDFRAGMHLDLARAQGEFGKIEKKRTANVGTYSYKYADLTDILAAVRDPLAKYGFSIVQDVTSIEGKIGVETRLLHASGLQLTSGRLYMVAGDTAQSAGAAITYARRYSLSALLGISTEDDTDAPQAKRRKASEASKGEGGATDRGGGDVDTASGPTSKAYPVDPTECSHKFPSGKWLPWKDDRCPKCGTPKVTAMEGTTADLGAA